MSSSAGGEPKAQPPLPGGDLRSPLPAGAHSAPLPATATRVRLAALTRLFGTRVAVDHLSLDIYPGELMALIGASGSGKTTTLRMVA